MSLEKNPFVMGFLFDSERNYTFIVEIIYDKGEGGVTKAMTSQTIKILKLILIFFKRN